MKGFSRSRLATAAFVTVLLVASCDSPQPLDNNNDAPANKGPAILPAHKGRPVPGPTGEGPALSLSRSAGPSTPVSLSSSSRPSTAQTPASFSDPGPVTHILWQNLTNGDRGFWPMVGTTYTGGWIGLGIVPMVWVIAAVGDFTGNGIPDIVWQNTSTGARGVWPMTGTTYAGGWSDIGQVPVEWDIAAVADFNADGKNDIVWQNKLTGIRGIWTMNGTTMVAWHSLGFVGPDWDIAAAGDFTGDNSPDLVWQNVSTGARGIWPMTGTSYTGGWHEVETVVTAWRIAAVGDFTGDTRLDWLWQNLNTGARGIWPMNGPTYSGGWYGLPNATTDWSIAGVLQDGAATPVISDVSPTILVAGQSATIIGTNFGSNPTVTVAGVNATITSVTPNSISITLPPGDVFPCRPTEPAPLMVTSSGGSTARSVLLRVGNSVTLTAGQSIVLSASAAQAACNDLSDVGGRYLIGVYSVDMNPTDLTSFTLVGASSGAGNVLVPEARAVAPLLPRATQQDLHNQRRHIEILEKNRAEYERLRRLFPNEHARRIDSVAFNQAVPNVGDILTFRVPNLNASNFCSVYAAEISARVVHVGTKSIVAVDVNSPLGTSADPTYVTVSQEYDGVMEPIVRTNFGDPTRTDANTDVNGRIIMLYTPVINQQFQGIAGFVVSCDFFPRQPGNESSNRGEIFYARVPVVQGDVSVADSPEHWRRSMRSTVIHEVKHIASQGARVSIGASFEASWLEEGTARHAEELWARSAIYGVGWKANTGYGSAANPNSMWCDVRPTWTACLGKPFAMLKHFQTLYTALTQSAGFSPFGAVTTNDATFYATAWSLVRYAIDRYAVSDAAFLTALTQSNLTGVSNLAARAGTNYETLLGRWLSALALDDHPTTPFGVEYAIPTWNHRNIYAGLNQDFPTTFLGYPVTPSALSYGNFASSRSNLHGGSGAWWELAGSPSGGQSVAVRNLANNGPAPSSVRMYIVRMN